MDKEENTLYEFGPFRLDLVEKVLWREGGSVSLTPKAFDTLVVLVDRRGHLVEKDELIKQLWPDNFVEDNSLSQNIYLLRKALGEDAHEQRFIETVPRRGYRFIADVRKVERIPASAAPTKSDERPLVEGSGSETHADSEPPPVKPHISIRSLPPVRYVGVILLIVVLALGSLWLLRERAPLAQASSAPRAIAVLPLKPLGALGMESRDEHLGLGITDAIIAKFSNLTQVSVRPTSAIYKFAGSAYVLSKVGEELRVDAILEGTVQRIDDRVRVTVQLIDVRSEQPLWAERFDEKFTNVFALQDAVSEQVARALSLRLTSDERKLLARRYTNNSEAYQAYTRGLFFWNKRTEDGLTRSIEYFKEAIEKDPNYAQAWAGLADTYAIIGYLGYKVLPNKEAFEKTLEAANRSLEIDPTMAEAHIALSVVKAYRDNDLHGAEEEAKKAISLKANFATAHHRYSIYLRDQGRLNEALLEIQLAHELDPLSLTIGSNLAYILYLQRSYDEAAEHCQKVLETESDFFQSLIALGMTWQQKLKYKEAIALLEKVREQSRGRAGVYYNALETLGHAYAVSGRREAARKIISELNAFPEDKDDTIYHQALVYAGLGETNKAFELLEENAKTWSLPPVTLRLDPRFDNLRADARYGKLMKKKFGGG
ncbi:MAG: winged helix-turn-helix domain-containing protein [Acidobacteriota bacterium]